MSTRRPYAARVPLDVCREQLLDTAIRGYPGVSVDAIAREAGVTRPVVYGAFADLGDVLAVGLELRGRTNIDVEVASHVLIGVLEHFGRPLLEEPDRFEPDRLAAFAAGLLSVLGNRDQVGSPGQG